MNDKRKDIMNLLQNYVIYEKETDYFIGLDSDRYRVKLREYAARFTIKDAVDYIKNKGCFLEPDKTYYIQKVC